MESREVIDFSGRLSNNGLWWLTVKSASCSQPTVMFGSSGDRDRVGTLRLALPAQHSAFCSGLINRCGSALRQCDADERVEAWATRRSRGASPTVGREPHTAHQLRIPNARRTLGRGLGATQQKLDEGAGSAGAGTGEGRARRDDVGPSSLANKSRGSDARLNRSCCCSGCYC